MSSISPSKNFFAIFCCWCCCYGESTVHNWYGRDLPKCHAWQVIVWVIECPFRTFSAKVLDPSSYRLKSRCLPSSFLKRILVLRLILPSNLLLARHWQSYTFLNCHQSSLSKGKSTCFVCKECGHAAFQTEQWRLVRGTKEICWWIELTQESFLRCRSFWSFHFQPSRQDWFCSWQPFQNFRLCFWFQDEW